MTWNWQQDDWPHFAYDADAIQHLEEKYITLAGELRGVLRHFSSAQKDDFILTSLTHEALESSSIEGEVLDRDSVQSSLQYHLGMNPKRGKTHPKESGMAMLMKDVFSDFNQDLTEEILHQWNAMINSGCTDLETIGEYRHGPMQVVSGPYGRCKIHFAAPSAEVLSQEMNDFILWFNTSSDLSALTRAALAHLYFVCIHPYEDGNGRIARALAEKSLSQSQGVPALTNLSGRILAKRKAYYEALERNNKTLAVTDWVLYFGQVIIEAQQYALQKIELMLQKTKWYDEYAEQLNQRQIKVLDRLFAAEPEGFTGGLSAANYMTITNTTRATTTRDLQALVALGLLYQTGERRYTRYFLNLIM